MFPPDRRPPRTPPTPPGTARVLLTRGPWAELDKAIVGPALRIVLVTGGRAYRDHDTVYRALDVLRAEGLECVVQGGAHGADAWARLWCMTRGVPCATFHAWWDTMRKTAGPLRNGWMVRYSGATACLHFPGGDGTQDMLAKAAEAGMLVLDGAKIGGPPAVTPP